MSIVVRAGGRGRTPWELLDPEPRLPREDDTIILPEGWPNRAFAPFPAIDGLCERAAAVLADDRAAERLAVAGRETAAGYGLPTFEERWRELLVRLPDGVPGYP